MNKTYERLFFFAARDALYREEDNMRALFDKNKPLYTHYHHGIVGLSLPSMLYVIQKRLLYTRFPMGCLLEQPYPDDPTQTADMVITNSDYEVDSIIECEYWTGGDNNMMLSDIEKLQKSSFQGGKYLLVVELDGDDVDATAEATAREHPELVMVDRKTFNTYRYIPAEEKLKLSSMNMYLIRIRTPEDDIEHEHVEL